MAYQKQTWRDYDDTKTEVVNMGQGAVVTPERMNHIETGIANSADKQEVAAQLADKATKGEIGLSDLDKNKTKYDATWFSDDFLTDLSNNEINTTFLEPKSVTRDKLADKSVGPKNLQYNGILRNKGIVYPFKNLARDGALQPERPHVDDVVLDAKLYGGDLDKLYRIEFLGNGISVGQVVNSYTINFYSYDKDWTNKTSLLGFYELDKQSNEPPTEQIETRIYYPSGGLKLVLTIDWSGFGGLNQLNLEGGPGGKGYVLDPTCILPVSGKDTMVELESKIGDPTDLKNNLIMAHDRISTLTNRDPFVYKPFDKAYITIVWDDARWDMDSQFRLWEEYGIPFSVAIPSDILMGNKILDGTGEKRRLIDWVDEIVSDPKNELLGHGYKHIGITGNQTEEQVDWELGYAKMQYMKLGYNVQGSMLAGDVDHLGEYAVGNYDDAGWGYVAKRYYDYGDSLAYDDPYNQDRVSTPAPGNVQSVINNAIQNKTWLTYFAHTMGGQEPNNTEENMRALIEHVQSLGIDKIEFTTYRHMYNTFGSTELRQRIENLEK